jgi:hypothetical protein
VQFHVTHFRVASERVHESHFISFYVQCITTDSQQYESSVKKGFNTLLGAGRAAHVTTEAVLRERRERARKHALNVGKYRQATVASSFNYKPVVEKKSVKVRSCLFSLLSSLFSNQFSLSSSRFFTRTY